MIFCQFPEEKKNGIWEVMKELDVLSAYAEHGMNRIGQETGEESIWAEPKKKNLWENRGIVPLLLAVKAIDSLSVVVHHPSHPTPPPPNPTSLSLWSGLGTDRRTLTFNILHLLRSGLGKKHIVPAYLVLFSTSVEKKLLHDVSTSTIFYSFVTLLQRHCSEHIAFFLFDLSENLWLIAEIYLCNNTSVI